MTSEHSFVVAPGQTVLVTYPLDWLGNCPKQAVLHPNISQLIRDYSFSLPLWHTMHSSICLGSACVLAPKAHLVYTIKLLFVVIATGALPLANTQVTAIVFFNWF